jgi:hypothetical protein
VAILLALESPAPGRRVKAAFGVASDRLPPSLDAASARLDIGACEKDGED